MNKTKTYLDELVEKYETKDFIKDDPIQFPHLYKSREDIEIAGFIAAMFAYGNRTVFVKKLKTFFDYVGNSPLDFVLNGDIHCDFCKNFDYRFSKGVDFIQILEILRELYSNSSLMELFKYGYEQERNVKQMFQTVTDYFYSRVTMPVTKGFYHLLPNPQKNSAMKRMCMFLRWMVRKPVVDLGIWKFIKPSELLIPLDVHVARVSRNMGLLTRKSNDFKSVVELMCELRKFCPEDPVKYDFAMFAYGIEEANKEKGF